MSQLDRSLGRVHKFFVGGLLGLFCLSLAGCAPEPQVPAGQPVKGFHTEPQGENWSAPIDDVDLTAKSTVLPESFPAGSFQLPETGVIDDAGQYDDQTWFLVFREDALFDANSLLELLIQQNNMSVHSDDLTSDGGRSGVASNETVSVDFLTLEAEDQLGLLSLVISQS